MKMKTWQIQKEGREIFIRLFKQQDRDSADVGAILCCALGNLLVNSPDLESFLEHKQVMMETISNFEWQI